MDHHAKQVNALARHGFAELSDTEMRNALALREVRVMEQSSLGAARGSATRFRSTCANVMVGGREAGSIASVTVLDWVWDETPDYHGSTCSSVPT